MEYRSLGRTGAQVSVWCLGVMTFGWKTEQEEATRMVDRFLEAGGNFIDTANVYGRGKSETMLGNALKDGKRDRVFLAHCDCHAALAVRSVGRAAVHSRELVSAR